MNLTRILKEIEHDIISRSGIIRPNPIDNSTFDLINTTIIPKIWNKLVYDCDNLSDYEAIENLKDNYRNEFMTLLHNAVVKQKHFNWF